MNRWKEMYEDGLCTGKEARYGLITDIQIDCSVFALSSAMAVDQEFLDGLRGGEEAIDKLNEIWEEVTS